MDSIFYYDIDTIVDFVQKGSGYVASHSATRSRKKHGLQRVRVEEISDILIKLGWRNDYIAKLFSHVDDSLFVNWPDNLLIEGLAKGFIQHLINIDSIRDSLEQIGLRHDIAESLETIVKHLVGTSYSKTQVLDNAIEYLLGDYKPISPIHATHLIEPAHLNYWKPYMIESKTISIYNISSQCIRRPIAVKQVKDALKTLPKTPDTTYYFHATSWKSSLHIMDRINRLKGRYCLDFTIFPSFYLSPSVVDSVDWCLKKKDLFSNELAILVFTIPNTLPADISIKELKDTEWINVTKEARECRQKETEIKAIRDYDLLYGDMVSNPNEVKLQNHVPQKHTPPKKQLVGRTDKSEILFHNCLVGCIYFQKSGGSKE